MAFVQRTPRMARVVNLGTKDVVYIQVSDIDKIGGTIHLSFTGCPDLNGEYSVGQGANFEVGGERVRVTFLRWAHGDPKHNAPDLSFTCNQSKIHIYRV